LRKSIIPGAAIVASLAFAGIAHADTNVQSLSGDWSTSNSTVAKTADGVHFGTYADGGAIGGSLKYKGANGLKLSDVKDYSFTFNYKQAGNLTGATPYARILLDTNGDHVTDARVILDPSLGGRVLPVQGADINFGTANDSVRYNDDAGTDAQLSWADVKSDHGTDVITDVLVSQGYSMGADVSAMLKSITFNGTKFNFGAAPADGHDGRNGHGGANGANGANGAPGANGVTTIIHDRGHLTGATMRTVRVHTLNGKKLVSVRATLRGKRLHTSGRKIKVDLRGKTEGNYNVVITAKYKTKHRKLHMVRSVRTLSITHS
jgi:hypothetical protein